MSPFENWAGRRVSPEESKQILAERLADLFRSGPSPGPAVALEVGCGDGRFSTVLHQTLFSWHPDPGTRLYSLDLERTAVAATHRQFRSAETRGACALQGDLYRAPFPEQRFDYFFAFNVLYWADRGRLLAEAHRLLKPQGKLLSYDLLPVSTPASRPVFFFTLNRAQIGLSSPGAG